MEKGLRCYAAHEEIYEPGVKEKMCIREITESILSQEQRG